MALRPRRLMALRQRRLMAVRPSPAGLRGFT
ncbi:MAG: hypothetical protein RIQ46_1203 [Pseudomonadota bacterium]|jgi:hypothetical protein